MALELLAINKRFGDVCANDDVRLRVEAGSRHGLLGENGAGKSTLMKILSGFLRPDSGKILLDGKQIRLGSPTEAIAAGIGMLHQDPLVFLPFSVLDNFALGAPGPLDRARIADQLAATADRFGFNFDPVAPVRTLTVGERQQLEICRLLWLGARVLVFDEPTTGISALQRLKLFATLRSLSTGQPPGGGLSVIFVTHKLEEIEELCDSATVLRQGRVVGRVTMPVPARDLVRMMFGRVAPAAERASVPLGGARLSLEGVSIRRGSTAIEDLTMSVAAGEVVGLAGLEGSGQRDLLRACAGLTRLDAGRLLLDATDLTHRPYRSRLEAGVHLVPAGRLEEGLVPGLSIAEHLAIITPSPGFWVDRDKAEDAARVGITSHRINGIPASTAESLSGGNQQRLLLAMMPEPVKLLLLEHPTRGLDIESSEFIWEKLLGRREIGTSGTSGTSIVFASSDLDELLRYSDRIVVFFSGRVLMVVNTAATSGEELGYLIGGKVPV